ncbi:MAG: hypothetical protein ACOX8E_07370 [Ruminococcus sp.]|jgi:hypothetical protein
MNHQSVESQNMAQEQQQEVNSQQNQELQDNQQSQQEAAEQPSGQEAAEQQQPQQQEEKLFTQEEVNKIVRDRLSRAKHLPAAEFDRRERELNERELRLDAREKLADAGVPKELLPLVNCSSKENMESSIELINAYFKKTESRPYKVMSTGVPSGGSSSVMGKEAGENEIRQAMGLKGR